MAARAQVVRRLAIAATVALGMLVAPTAGASADVTPSVAPTRSTIPTPPPTDTPPPTETPPPTDPPTDPPSTPPPTTEPPTTPPPTTPPSTPPTSPPPTGPPPTSSPPSTPPTGNPPTGNPPTTRPPTGTPSPTPGGGSTDPGDIPSITLPIDPEAAAAYAAATTRLRELTVALAKAEALVAGGDARLSMSAGHLRRTQAAADVAAHTVQVLRDDLAAARSLLGAAHLSVEGDARRAYQDGAAGAWSTVLAAEDASSFANRATNLETVSATRGHAFGLLSELPDTITRLETATVAAREALASARGEASGAAAAHARLAADIAAGRASIEPLRKDVAAAVLAATAAIPADQALAVERRRESDRLAADMVAASAALAASGGVVEGTGSFARPATGVITSQYGWRTHPILGYRKFHYGIDYDGSDDIVYAADSGVVILTVWSGAYGNVTVVDHGSSGGRYLATVYGHQAGFFVDEGDVVRKGQPIGAVGTTGLSTGPHLHFEVRLDGVPVDPNPFLD